MTKQIIIIIILCLFLIGCKSNTTIPVITQDDIFEIEEKKYYILFSKDDCSGCDAIMGDAIRYHQYSLINSKAPKIFIVSLDDPANKDIIGKEDLIIGASSLSKLKITRTPTLIIIKDNVVIDGYINSTKVGSFFEAALSK